MGIARYKDVIMDAADAAALGAFRAQVLDLTWHPQEGSSDGWLSGPTPQHTIWVSQVAEPMAVKNRVHLDIYATSLDALQDLGAEIVLPRGDDRYWTVMADPEGTRFCAFLREELPPDRVHGLVVDGE